MAFYETTYLMANRRWVRPRIEFNLLLNGITRSPSNRHNREVNYFGGAENRKKMEELSCEPYIRTNFRAVAPYEGRANQSYT